MAARREDVQMPEARQHLQVRVRQQPGEVLPHGGRGFRVVFTVQQVHGAGHSGGHAGQVLVDHADEHRPQRPGVGVVRAAEKAAHPLRAKAQPVEVLQRLERGDAAPAREFFHGGTAAWQPGGGHQEQSVHQVRVAGRQLQAHPAAEGMPHPHALAARQGAQPRGGVVGVVLRAPGGGRHG
jgi:hypothetical protein